MGWDVDFLLGLLAHNFSYWWIIIPAVLLGIVVGAVPGFNAQNTLIILLPVTLTMEVEKALTFMVALYCAT
ncbi:MAG: tripartite tricarboxylate transporter permease, partial [Rhodospirillales bacterium]|nr:tripartite tricarboxylate transporter permease [Rhodospirillales bacterium]